MPVCWELGELRRLTAEVACFCRQYPAGDAAESNLNLVLEGPFVNVLEHGWCRGLPDAVEVRLSLSHLRARRQRAPAYGEGDLATVASLAAPTASTLPDQVHIQATLKVLDYAPSPT